MQIVIVFYLEIPATVHNLNYLLKTFISLDW